MNSRGCLLHAMAMLMLVTLAGSEKTTSDCVSTCGKNAHCDSSREYPDCMCDHSFFGSPYAGCTATPECTRDADCAEDKVCSGNNLCHSPCSTHCPADAGCRVKDHKAECLFDGSLYFQGSKPTPPPPQ